MNWLQLRILCVERESHESRAAFAVELQLVVTDAWWRWHDVCRLAGRYRHSADSRRPDDEAVSGRRTWRRQRRRMARLLRHVCASCQTREDVSLHPLHRFRSSTLTSQQGPILKFESRVGYVIAAGMFCPLSTYSALPHSSGCLELGTGTGQCRSLEGYEL